MPLITLYTLLNVSQDASAEDIRKAYKQRVLSTHPDKLEPGASDALRQAAEARFRQVKVAFDTLGDPLKRRLYDYSLRQLPTPPAPPLRTHTSASFADYQEKLNRDREEWAKRTEERQRERMRTPSTYANSPPSTPSTDGPATSPRFSRRASSATSETTSNPSTSRTRATSAGSSRAQPQTPQSDASQEATPEFKHTPFSRSPESLSSVFDDVSPPKSTAPPQGRKTSWSPPNLSSVNFHPLPKPPVEPKSPERKRPLPKPPQPNLRKSEGPQFSNPSAPRDLATTSNIDTLRTPTDNPELLNTQSVQRPTLRPLPTKLKFYAPNFPMVAGARPTPPSRTSSFLPEPISTPPSLPKYDDDIDLMEQLLREMRAGNPEWEERRKEVLMRRGATIGSELL